jgi:hypothetical protein
MRDHWLGERQKLRMAAAEIFLAVVGTRTRRTAANWALSGVHELAALAGPATFRALHTVLNAGEKLFKRHFQ